MPSLRSIGTLDLKYPIFASAFDINDNLIVGGGGGEGKNGIGNSLTIVCINEDNKENVMEVKETLKLAPDEDNPTSLDVSGDGVLFAGVNRSTNQIKQKKNDHLRVFKRDDNGAFKKNGSYTVFPAFDLDEYQRVTRVSTDGDKLALVTSSNSGKIYILDAEDPSRTICEIVAPGDKPLEINDVHFHPSDSDYLAFCTTNAIYIAESNTGKIINKRQKRGNDQAFAKLKFADDSTLLSVSNAKNRRGFWLNRYQVDWKASSDKEEDRQECCLAFNLLFSRRIAKKGTAVAFDAGAKYIAIASSDFNIYITNLTVSGTEKIAEPHSFAITSLSFNEDQTLLASTSVDNTVKVFGLPENGQLSFSGSISLAVIIAVIASLLIVGLAVILGTVIQRQVILDLISSTEPASVPREGEGVSLIGRYMGIAGEGEGQWGDGESVQGEVATEAPVEEILVEKISVEKVPITEIPAEETPIEHVQVEYGGEDLGENFGEDLGESLGEDRSESHREDRQESHAENLKESLGGEDFRDEKRGENLENEGLGNENPEENLQENLQENLGHENLGKDDL